MALLHPQTEIDFGPAEWAEGLAQLNRYANGQRSATLREHMTAIVVLNAQTEFLVQLASATSTGDAPADAATETWVWDRICHGSGAQKTCVFGESQELADAVGYGDLYRATQQITRDLYNEAQAIDLPPHGLPPGGVEGMGVLPAIPIAGYWALALGGAAAAAALAWWGADMNEKDAQVSIHSATLATQLAQYQQWLDDNWRRGGPPPEAPPFVRAASSEDAASTWWALGTGLLLGGIAVVGIQQGAKTPRGTRTIRRVTNPHRRRRNPPPGVRAVGVKEHSRKRPPKKKKATTKKKKAAPKRKKPATKKKATRKRNAKKAAPKRTKKTTPRRAKVTTKKKTTRKKNAKKAKSKRVTKASFIRGQLRKKRSKKQAAADWNGRQRFKKKRNPKKAKRRRRAA